MFPSCICTHSYEAALYHVCYAAHWIRVCIGVQRKHTQKDKATATHARVHPHIRTCGEEHPRPPPPPPPRLPHTHPHLHPHASTYARTANRVAYDNPYNKNKANTTHPSRDPLPHLVWNIVFDTSLKPCLSEENENTPPRPRCSAGGDT